jgi:hypothetical protein
VALTIFAHGQTVKRVAVDGEQVVTADECGTVMLWRETGELIAALSLDSYPLAVRFSRCSDLVIVDGRLTYYRLGLRSKENQRPRTPGAD